MPNKEQTILKLKDLLLNTKPIDSVELELITNLIMALGCKKRTYMNVAPEVKIPDYIRDLGFEITPKANVLKISWDHLANNINIAAEMAELVKAKAISSSEHLNESIDSHVKSILKYTLDDIKEIAKDGHSFHSIRPDRKHTINIYDQIIRKVKERLQRLGFTVILDDVPVGFKGDLEYAPYQLYISW